MELSISQANRLGERLRRSDRLEASDIRLLDTLRRSFESAHRQVVDTIHRELGLRPTERFGKTTGSIVAKLKRERTRLSKMQDIAGCRLLVTDGIDAQDAVVEKLSTLFPGAEIQDLRDQPRNGYRAIHIIVTIGGKPIEVQVRTRLQHHWAELSEKGADVIDREIKYGGGPAVVRQALDQLSELIRGTEGLRRPSGLTPPQNDVWLEKNMDKVRELESSLIQTLDNLRSRIDDLAKGTSK